jgi:alkanesulfonate monooxygenase SsuD/methylene tetrahydromethanopterin reductase-like flavin-dependent oxidoreductase (luciferase family)
VQFGLALPQYDYSLAGDDPLQFASIVEYARVAVAAGAASLWMSDHLFLDLEKYGGSAERKGCYDPLVTLGALARIVPDARLGTLVMCEALRPASVLAKAFASLDCITGGRLDVGLGAGWYEPEYEAIGMAMPAPRERLDRLIDALAVVRGLVGGGPLTYDGKYHRAVDAPNRPAARQQPHPRVMVGGTGDRLLRIVAEYADGWNTCWVWTPDDYRSRLRVLERACETVGRDPARVWRTLGLYALCGEDERDLERRFARMKATAPAGVMDTFDLASFRKGRLVGTVEQVQAQVRDWDALGIETLIVGVGAVPFHVSSADDVELLLHACTTA